MVTQALREQLTGKSANAQMDQGDKGRKDWNTLYDKEKFGEKSREAGITKG